MDSVDQQWSDATRSAAEIADYMHRFAFMRAVLAEHSKGLTDDKLTEAIRPLMARMHDEMAKEVAHYRQQLLAATTRAPLQ